MTKAILIDPFSRSIVSVEKDLNDLATVNEILKCELFDCERVGDANDVLVMDDNGLLKNPQFQEYFKLSYQANGYPKEVILAGLVLIAGLDDDGNFVEPSITIETVNLCWLDHEVGSNFAKQFQ